MTSPLLDVSKLTAGYGPLDIVRSLTFRIHKGEVVTLIGRNGMGKTTTVRAVTGQIPAKTGTITFGREAIAGWPIHKIARAGIGVVPEGRMIFPNLSVEENLLIGETRGGPQGRAWKLDDIYKMFPRLKERARNLGCNLSGGEQQMLAIGRALLTSPLLLILDEATEGLAPIIRDEIWRCLSELKNAGLSILVIDKNLGPLSKLADQHWVIEKGEFVWNGDSEAFARDQDKIRQFMSV
jgi:branched-chain amino acid transport system ATP-binding protein